MIPMGRLSTEPTPADFISPDDLDPPDALTDYELGGRALNDPSEGLQVHVWRGYVEGNGKVYLEAPGQPSTLIFTAAGITEMRFTFDQNMRPFIAYTQNLRPKIRWYDTVAGENVITQLTDGDRNLRCALDDKRDMQTSQGTNDIILAYVRGTSLYYRQQRDRYENEYLLTDAIPAPFFLRFGMNKAGRLQFEFL
jgi:hypothetical protein